MLPNNGTTTSTQVRIASGINVLIGLWLIIAPFALAYESSQGYWNDIIVGILIGAFALMRFMGAFRAAWLSWINVLLGIWLIIAPFALGYATARSHWNDVIVGIIVAVLAAWSAFAGSPAGRVTPTQARG